MIVDAVDLEASRAFYERALEPLGISIVMELEGRTAFGPESGRPQFWLVARDDSGATGRTHRRRRLQP